MHGWEDVAASQAVQVAGVEEGQLYVTGGLVVLESLPHWKLEDVGGGGGGRQGARGGGLGGGEGGGGGLSGGGRGGLGGGGSSGDRGGGRGGGGANASMDRSALFKFKCPPVTHKPLKDEYLSTLFIKAALI